MTEPTSHSDHLSAYLDGELSAEQARAVETALAEDQALAEELRQLRATRDLLAQLPRSAARPDFTAEVMQRVSRRPALRLWPRVLAVAATLVVLAGAALTVLYWNSLTQQNAATETGPVSIGEIARDMSDETAPEPATTDAPAAPAVAAAEDRAEGVTSELPPPPAERFVADEPRLALEPEPSDEGPSARGAEPSPGESRIVAKGKAAPEPSLARNVDSNTLPPANAIARTKGGRPGSYQPSPLDDGRLRTTPHLTHEELRELAASTRTDQATVIYTNNLRIGQHQVEQVLSQNAVALAEPRQSELLACQAARVVPARSSGKAPADRTIAYVVYAPAEQVANIRKALQQEVIPKQVVTQAREPLYQRVVQEHQTRLARAEKPTRRSDRELLDYYDQRARSKAAPEPTPPASEAPKAIQTAPQPAVVRAGNQEAAEWTRQQPTPDLNESADGLLPVEPLSNDDIPAAGAELNQARQSDQQGIPIAQAQRAQQLSQPKGQSHRREGDLVAIVIRLRYRPDVPLSAAQRELLGMDRPASQPGSTPASGPAGDPTGR